MRFQSYAVAFDVVANTTATVAKPNVARIASGSRTPKIPICILPGDWVAFAQHAKATVAETHRRLQGKARVVHLLLSHAAGPVTAGSISIVRKAENLGTLSLARNRMDVAVTDE